MTKEELYAHPGWEWCTFEGARKQVLLLSLESSFREKLEWLEEAENLFLRMQMTLPSNGNNSAPPKQISERGSAHSSAAE